MTRMTLRLMIVAAAVATLVAVGAAQQKVDLTGKWTFNVQTDAGTGTPTFDVKQEGEKLSGHYAGTLGESEFTGTSNGKDFTIQFSVDAQGMKLDVTYKGTIESKDSVKGSVNIAGLGEGSFTGTRQ